MGGKISEIRSSLTSLRNAWAEPSKSMEISSSNQVPPAIHFSMVKRWGQKPLINCWRPKKIEMALMASVIRNRPN